LLSKGELSDGYQGGDPLERRGAFARRGGLWTAINGMNGLIAREVRRRPGERERGNGFLQDVPGEGGKQSLAIVEKGVEQKEAVCCVWGSGAGGVNLGKGAKY